MYRLLEKSGQTANSRHPARATAKEAGDRQGSLKKARWRNHRPQLLGGQ
jgi:hypothetical protein